MQADWFARGDHWCFARLVWEGGLDGVVLLLHVVSAAGWLVKLEAYTKASAIYDYHTV
jgi:hypothetical protein